MWSSFKLVSWSPREHNSTWHRLNYSCTRKSLGAREAAGCLQALLGSKAYVKYQNASLWGTVIGQPLFTHPCNSITGQETHMEMGWHRDPGTGQRRAVGMCPWWNCQVTGYCAHQLTHTNPKNFLALRPPPKRTLPL